MNKLALLPLVVASLMTATACNKPATPAAPAPAAAPAASTPAPAASAPAASAPAPITAESSFEDRCAYAVGASVGSYVRHMKEAQEEFTGVLKEDYLKLGFAEALSGQQSLPREEVEKILRALDEKVREGLTKKMQEEAKANLEAGKKYLEENAKKEGVKVTKSGLQYKVITEGQGDRVAEGDTVSVKYKGSTIEGKVFDEQTSAVDFPINSGMIPGWVEGMQLMNKGAHYEFTLPAELGYGENGAGDMIKANSVLIFDVELVDIKKPEVKPEAKDKAEAREEAKTEAKEEAKTEAKEEAKTEAKEEVKTEAKEEVKTEAKGEAKSE